MDYRAILKRYWGYDDFRGIQRQIVESIGQGYDTLGLMPTGGGKSITFQVPALAKEGVCLVITPLIALMKDQVHHLRRRGIRAEAIHSGLSHDDILRILENAVFGAVKLLYVSPERLASELFLTKLQHMTVSFITVDEAHCISQWGYDFRPSYLTIATVRRLLPHAPVLALTATATPLVVGDIQNRLTLPELRRPPFRVFRMSFERQNLAYRVQHTDNKELALLQLLQEEDGSAIVYTRSRQRTRDLADMLTAQGHSATFYHAGLDEPTKDRRQKDWQAGRVNIIVATNAFGMGIDKADVRLVVHADCPDSIEAYFQEAGRAGRDGLPARAVLLYDGADRQRLRSSIDNDFPPKDEIRLVYEHLAYFYQVAVGSGYNATFEFPIEKFCRTYHHFSTRVTAALKILDRAGYIRYRDEEDGQARLRFCLERDDLYRLRGNSPREDAVIVALLRNFSGLFTDYCYIDESIIADKTGLSRPDVYLTLKELGRKRIVDFIPQKSIPLVSFAQRREDSDQLVFPPAVYDELRARQVERVNSILDYAQSEHCCRSRMLLRYFGEQSDHDCGQCDVCLQHSGAVDSAGLAAARQRILDLLADRKPHHVTMFAMLPLPAQAVEEALVQLVDEEHVIDDDGMLTLGD